MFLLSLFKILIYYLTKFLFQLVFSIENFCFSCFSDKSTKNNYLATNLALLTHSKYLLFMNIMRKGRKLMSWIIYPVK